LSDKINLKEKKKRKLKKNKENNALLNFSVLMFS